MRSLAAIGALLLTACAHASGTFELNAPDNRASDVEEAHAAATQALAPSSQALIATVTHGAAPELVLYDVGANRKLWQRPVALEARPVIVEDVVLGAGVDVLQAWNLADGAPRWRAPLSEPLWLGATGAAGRIVFAESTADASASTIAALDARTGRRLWTHAVRGAVGRPVVRGDAVFVPWQRQHLVVLDARDGHARARLRATDHVFEWLRSEPDGLYFGKDAIQHFAHARYDGTRASLPRIELPVPGWTGAPPPPETSSFSAAPARRSAFGRVALHFAPSARDGSIGLAGDRFYLVFYRAVLAFDPAGAVVWARTLEDDVIAASASAIGLTVVREGGRVTVFDAASGQAQRDATLGVDLASATLDVAALEPMAPQAPHASSVRAELAALALDQDSRLLPVRVLAARALGALPEPEATRDLLDIVAQRTTPPELQRAVADVLATRKSGSEHLVAALDARYDFLEQTRPAPLAVIVPALVALNERAAVPGLMDRLQDHETPSASLPTIVIALGRLGDAQTATVLADFLRDYHADSAFADEPEVLIEAARAVLQHGSQGASNVVTTLAGDPHTTPRLAAALSALAAPRGAPEAEPIEAVAAAPAAPPDRPLGERVQATFAAHVDEVRGCVIEELDRNPDLAQVRLAFIVERDGSTHAWSFVPNTESFVDCMYPKVASYDFGQSSTPREIASYVIAVRARPETAGPDRATDGPWWARAEHVRRPASGRAPWWTRSALAPSSPSAATPLLPAEPVSTPSEPPAEVVQPPAAVAQEPTPSEAPAAVAPASEEDAWWLPAVGE